MEEKREEKKVAKTRQGSGYLKQLYSTARVTANSTHSNLKNLTTFLVNFIPTDKIQASELQVRSHFDDEEIQALSHSIKEHGVLQPILVVQDGDGYKVIAGERRLRASRLAGMERIPARVLTTDDKATHEIALRENLDRVDLHPLEEGEGYVSLLEAKAYTSYEAISKAFGKPKSRVTECIGFTRLPDATKAELMKVGLKNRALLRKLLTLPPEQHSAIIAAAVGQEETLLPDSKIAEQLAKAGDEATGGDAEKKAISKREIPAFAYECDEKGLRVPGFRWKAGEGAEKLRSYIDALMRLIDESESKHLKASPSSTPQA
ncbi:MAG: ParB/RepB/Spo0J family partition protein [Bdellovibrionales bacterium]|nr:ParB/RepB/Spo0J family partition protein [Bdellovibrionales bacterium]